MTRPLKRHIEMEKLFGADFLPLSRKPAAAPRVAASSTGSGQAPAKAGYPWEQDYPADFLAIRDEARACTKCGLCKTRTQAVFGTGPVTAPLMFVGEAPGEDEDRKGEPFVGRAGQLLTSTLKKLGVDRSRVYIANILKCRPPGNRTPQADEMLACMPFLLRQIQAIRPKLLCLMGNISAQTLLNTKTGITKLRGKPAEAHGVPAFPTFHPAYILRNMSDLPLFEADLKEACRKAGLIP